MPGFTARLFPVSVLGKLVASEFPSQGSSLRDRGGGCSSCERVTLVQRTSGAVSSTVTVIPEVNIWQSRERVAYKCPMCRGSISPSHQKNLGRRITTYVKSLV